MAGGAIPALIIQMKIRNTDLRVRETLLYSRVGLRQTEKIAIMQCNIT